MNTAATRSLSSSTSGTRLYGSGLVIVKATWIALVALTLGFFVIGLPGYYQQLQTACHDATTCGVYSALNTKGLQALASLGFPTTAYAGYNTALFVFITLIWGIVGFIIFWHRSDDWMGLLVAYGLIAFNPTFQGGPSYVLAMNLPALYIPTMLVSFLGQSSITFFFYLFPNGRFVPRWIAWFAILPIIGGIAQVVPATNSFSYANWPTWLNFLEVFTLTTTILFSQIYRYTRISAAVQRQQTKWVIYGIVVAILGNLGLGIFFSIFFQGLLQPNTPYQVLPNSAWPLLLLSLPVCAGIAALRYRLYDIDVLINRTLVYSALTTILVLTYVGLVFALQSLTHALTGQAGDNPLLIIASTLAIAALFHPLRRRIQAFIDRRFYRRKYDASKTLAAFTATLHQEVDLGQLREELVAVVQETMQPTHVSLWLRPSASTRKQPGVWSRSRPALEEEKRSN